VFSSAVLILLKPPDFWGLFFLPFSA